MAYDKDGDGTLDIYFNNVLLLSAKYDEFNYFRDYAKTPINEDVEHGEVNANFLATSTDEASFNKTYHEDFLLGTSRRRNLYITNHRLLTHNHKAIADTLEYYGRKNKKGGAVEMMKYQKENMVTPNDAMKLTEEERKTKIIVGKLCETNRGEFTDEYLKIIDKARAN